MLFVVSPKTEITMELNWIEQSFFVWWRLKIWILNIALNAFELIYLDRLSTEITAQTTFLLWIFCKVPAKKSQKETNVVFLLIDLIKAHNFFEHEMMCLGVIPNVLTIEERILDWCRFLVKLSIYLFHGHINILLADGISLFISVNTILLMFLQFSFQFLLMVFGWLSKINFFETDIALKGRLSNWNKADRGQSIWIEEWKWLVLPDIELILPGSRQNVFYFMTHK